MSGSTFDFQSIPSLQDWNKRFFQVPIRALREQIHSYRVHCKSYCSVYSAEQHLSFSADLGKLNGN